MHREQGWSTSVTSWFLPTSYTATTVDCVATTLGGAYAGIYLPVPLATTTSSSTRTASVTSSMTSTTTTTTFVASDVGMMVGTSVASIAFVIVVGLCVWQAHAGNVNLKVNIDAKASCKWMTESVKTAKLGVRAFEPRREPRPAWEGEPSPQVEEVKPGPHTQRDAQEHFWDWARDVAQSASQPELPRGTSFGFGQSVASTPPSMPRPHIPVARQPDDKEEYFQSFAQELNDIIGSGMPNMIADTPAMPKTPPPPPPKRNAIPDIAPPTTAWSQRLSQRSITTEATPSLPPPPPVLENAERIDVRVDQAFSDWANDFALCMPPSPTQAKGIPPPPPPRRAPAQSTLPLPPPRPPSIASGSSGRLSQQPLPTLPPSSSAREFDPHEWNQLSHRPSFALVQAVPWLILRKASLEFS